MLRLSEWARRRRILSHFQDGMCGLNTCVREFFLCCVSQNGVRATMAFVHGPLSFSKKEPVDDVGLGQWTSSKFGFQNNQRTYLKPSVGWFWVGSLRKLGWFFWNFQNPKPGGNFILKFYKPWTAHNRRLEQNQRTTHIYIYIYIWIYLTWVFFTLFNPG